jgi:glycosyltransferase involved in cell wall biosynthesis
MNIPLTIIGDGPERAELEARAGQNVRFLGHRDRDFVQAAMRAAALLVVPSVWFEMFPMTVVEAMANGTPLVVSKIGALAEIVEDGVTGMHFEVGSSAGLARAVRAICEDRERLMLMGQSARKHYEAFLSPKVSLGNLEEIYREVACV